MNQNELKNLLNQLIYGGESEIVEFKKTLSNDPDMDEVGRYFSALSNEANLRNIESAWLVYGVTDKGNIVGTKYPQSLNILKREIGQNARGAAFRNVYIMSDKGVDVILFEIPPAPHGVPVEWKGHYYSRNGDSLVPLPLTKLDEIRNQTLLQDWSAQIVEKASFADLDPDALHRAREMFAKQHEARFKREDVEKWSLEDFLNKARITQNSKITRTALLLLGKSESAWHLSPHMAQLSWKQEDSERAYAHFGLPFLLSTTQLYQRIGNPQIRLLPPGELLAHEFPKYDQKVVLEALHNCIAHQDYTRQSRVIVTEYTDRLVFKNHGVFFEGVKPNDYIEYNRTPLRYRNTYLVQAMVELNMIDKMGYGIRDMYERQAKRYFPLPDYKLDEESSEVELTIYGSVVDQAYTHLLMQKTDISLLDVLGLDRVQKKLPISNEAAVHLKKTGLIEGRKPNFYISASAAKVTDTKADYIRTRALDDEYYAKLLTEYLEKFGEVERAEINKFLLPKLSEVLSEEQKINKISNLLTKLRRKRLIINRGSDRASRWALAEIIAEKN